MKNASGQKVSWESVISVKVSLCAIRHMICATSFVVSNAQSAIARMGNGHPKGKIYAQRNIFNKAGA